MQVVFLALPDFPAVLRTLRTARGRLAEILSAAEFLDAECMGFVTKHLEGVANPLAQGDGQGEEWGVLDGSAVHALTLPSAVVSQPEPC